MKNVVLLLVVSFAFTIAAQKNESCRTTTGEKCVFPFRVIDTRREILIEYESCIWDDVVKDFICPTDPTLNGQFSMSLGRRSPWGICDNAMCPQRDCGMYGGNLYCDGNCHYWYDNPPDNIGVSCNDSCIELDDTVDLSKPCEPSRCIQYGYEDTLYDCISNTCV